MRSKYVVFFDGYCGLCNRSVDVLIKSDTQRKFQYNPLQGEYIKTLDVDIDLNNLKTLYVYDGCKLISKTKAWRTLADELGGVWGMLATISRVIPVFILDFVYDLIAKSRYRIFGERSSCRMPTPEERDLFID